MKNKVVFFLIVAISVISLALLISKLTDFKQLESATVNLNNGDLSAIYFDSERDGLCLVTYDSDGNKLYGLFIYSKGGTSARLVYHEDLLYVYVSRTNSLSIYDREGNLVKKITEDKLSQNQKEEMHMDAWEEWNKKIGTYTYQNNSLGLKYVYKEKISIFRKSKCVLYIEDSNGEQVICYHDNWK